MRGYSSLSFHPLKPPQDMTSHTFPHPIPLREGTAAKARALNEQGFCNVSGCTGRRRGFSNWCPKHLSVTKLYGHPKAGPIKARNYMPYRPWVAALFDANPEHPGLIANQGYVRQYMQRGLDNENAYLGAKEMARLARHAVTPRDVLIEVACIYCYLQDNPRAVPDLQSQEVAITRAVVRLAPQGRWYTPEALKKGTTGYPLRPRASALKAIGKHLRVVLSVFLVNVATAIAAREDSKQETIEASRAPLKQPTAVYLAEAATTRIRKKTST